MSKHITEQRMSRRAPPRKRTPPPPTWVDMTALPDFGVNNWRVCIECSKTRRRCICGPDRQWCGGCGHVDVCATCRDIVAWVEPMGEGNDPSISEIAQAAKTSEWKARSLEYMEWSSAEYEELNALMSSNDSGD